ncbi:MAG: hypothetical protein U0I00_00050 [Eggerthellaceae bacterium]|nr:hypothetical protein [Eggerthellaceae bacterium]
MVEVVRKHEQSKQGTSCKSDGACGFSCLGGIETGGAEGAGKGQRGNK